MTLMLEAGKVSEYWVKRLFMAEMMWCNECEDDIKEEDLHDYARVD